MTIVEHTPERLVVTLGAFFPHNATCTFDKTTGRARFERMLFLFSRRTIDVPLGDIVDFEVVEVGPPLNSFDPRVVLASGKRFYVSPAATREETHAVARAVRAFLGLGPSWPALTGAKCGGASPPPTRMSLRSIRATVATRRRNARCGRTPRTKKAPLACPAGYDRSRLTTMGIPPCIFRPGFAPACRSMPV